MLNIKLENFLSLFQKKNLKKEKKEQKSLKKIILNYECKPNYTNCDEYQNAKNEYDIMQNQILEGQILI